MPTADKTVLRCERCGEPFASGASQTGCLNCLLLDALEQSKDGPPPETPPASPLLPPTAGAHRYQHYEILTREDGTLWELGRGAMGVTYKALDVNLRVPVALKIINPRHAQSDATRQRFLREARAAARLRHPNVASVFHFGTITPDGDGKQEECFYAMEFVEGETLEERLRRTGPLDARQTVEVALQIARALVAAEQRGLVHRDLKPANVMLLAEAETAQPGKASGSQGEAWVKVIDFGLAKAVGATDADEPGDGRFGEETHGIFVGTPQFASPEQFDGRAVDVRSDLFSLGVLLWYVLTGELPFEGRSLAEIHDRQLHRPLPLAQLADAKVPELLGKLLGSLLAADPAARPASATVLHEQLESCREALRAAASPPPRRTFRDRWRPWAIAALVLGLLVAVGIFTAHRSQQYSPQASPTDKSVAVLPFENLSADPNNAFFADGVQDEVLTDLAKIADLKVISRSSVMRYKDPGKRDLREISQTLGVTYVVEGSVQRAGNKIRVNAQLIDARTDAHKWAERYDRDFSDVFTIQSDIAQAIAKQLQATISAQARAAITQVPTQDLQAYTLYVQARAMWNNAPNRDTPLSVAPAVGLLTQATRRDPQFVRAYALLALIHSRTYLYTDRTPQRAALTLQAVEAVEHLAPGSAEAHKAAGCYAYWIESNSARAREELLQAARLAPNDAQIFYLLGMVERCQGLGDDALAHFVKAEELDPEDSHIPTDRVNTLAWLRRYPEAIALVDHLRAVRPNDSALLAKLQVRKAFYTLWWKADVTEAQAIMTNLPAAYDGSDAMTMDRIWLDVFTRNRADAELALAACPQPEIGIIPRVCYEGLAAWTDGDRAAATQLFLAGRPLLMEKLKKEPDNDTLLIWLGVPDGALLGRKEEGIATVRHALALYPLDRDAFMGPTYTYQLAGVLAEAGEREEAIALIEKLCALPYGTSYGQLRTLPWLDNLRGDPRFEAALASIKPKEAVQ